MYEGVYECMDVVHVCGRCVSHQASVFVVDMNGPTNGYTHTDTAGAQTTTQMPSLADRIFRQRRCRNHVGDVKVRRHEHVVQRAGEVLPFPTSTESVVGEPTNVGTGLFSVCDVCGDGSHAWAQTDNG